MSETAFLVRGRAAANPFAMFGADENTATLALGWTLRQSPHLLRGMLGALKLEPPAAAATVEAQKGGADRGFSDLEVVIGTDIHLIIEAKVGWQQPTEQQLLRYLPRLLESKCARRLLVTLTASDQAYAARSQPSSLQDIPVLHLSWGNVHGLAQQASRAASSYTEKLWLSHFADLTYDYRQMRDHQSNLVFVVSLSRQRIREGNPYTWVDVVEQDGSYYHPIGNHWPVTPANYIGFRYDGKVQSVHHAEKVISVKQPSDHNAKWNDSDQDHFIYTLGPPMRPAVPLPSGKVLWAGRRWAALDLLLSGAAATLHDAVSMTHAREAEKG